MKNLLTAVVLAVCALPAFAQDAKTIRFGVTPTFAPFESLDASGKLVGLDIDIGHALCEKMKVTCEWVQMPFSGTIPALKSKKIDAILSAMSVSEKRRQQVLFTTVLWQDSSRLLVPKGKPLELTVESLKGKTIGVSQGTTQAAYANKHWKNQGVTIVTYQSSLLARQDLGLGRVDAVLSEVPPAIAFMEGHEGAKFQLSGESVNDPEVQGPGTAIALDLGNTALQAKLDAAIKELRSSGAYDEILKRYSKYDILAPN